MIYYSNICKYIFHVKTILEEHVSFDFLISLPNFLFTVSYYVCLFTFFFSLHLSLSFSFPCILSPSIPLFFSCPFIQIIIYLFSSLLSGSDPVGGIGLTDSESSANNANTKLHSKSAPLSLQNDQIIAAKNARTKYTGGGFAIR